MLALADTLAYKLIQWQDSKSRKIHEAIAKIVSHNNNLSKNISILTITIC